MEFPTTVHIDIGNKIFYIEKGREMVVSTRFSEKEFSCPVCGFVFSSRIVESVSHRGQDSDFFPHYLGDDPMPYFLVQCGSCGFCAYPGDYNLEGEKSKLLKHSFIRAVLEQPLSRKLSPDAQKFFLAGRIYERLEKDPYHIGSLYLRGSWCCRREEDRRAEIELQQLAVKFLRSSVERATGLNPDNVPVVTYLVGELYRRLEDRDEAREWFVSVEETMLDPGHQWIVDLAKQQAELNEHYIN